LNSVAFRRSAALDRVPRFSPDRYQKLNLWRNNHFEVKRFPHSINVSAPGSNLRVQLQTDPCCFDFVERASPREVLGLTLPVATLEDLLQGKIWAALEPERRGSKRKKDLLDIARLLESYPHLRERVPREILEQL
jgi:hypothetical protein